VHFFDEAEIAGGPHMTELIPVMRQAMIDFSAGRIFGGRQQGLG
jgi:hypothetical protein